MRYLALLIPMTLMITACNTPFAERRDSDLNHYETDIPTTVNDDQSIQSIADCPVTKNGASSLVPTTTGMSMLPGQFWFGTDKLWTSLPESGEWTGLPLSGEGYSQKTFWWSEGYSAVDEPEPDLRVTGVRLDIPAMKLHASIATHAMNTDIGSAMLVGVVLPSSGCWEITGRYKDGSLRYVIWIS